MSSSVPSQTWYVESPQLDAIDHGLRSNKYQSIVLSWHTIPSSKLLHFLFSANMSFWRKPFSDRAGSRVDTMGFSQDAPPPSEFTDGSIKYIGNQGGNDAAPTFQEASGAPVESDSPMGYSVSSFTILFLNINMMIGTGIFSTRKLTFVDLSSIAYHVQASAILSGTGSVGLSFIYWTM